jgi:hypothetical protein
MDGVSMVNGAKRQRQISQISTCVGQSVQSVSVLSVSVCCLSLVVLPSFFPFSLRFSPGLIQHWPAQLVPARSALLSTSFVRLSHPTFTFIPLPLSHSSPRRLLALTQPTSRRPGQLWHASGSIHRSFDPPFVLVQGQALPLIASAPFNHLSNLCDARLLADRWTPPRTTYRTGQQLLGMN